MMPEKETGDMEQAAEVLHRRIVRNRRYLRDGVYGALAIRYLRQIAEDDDALSGAKAPAQPA